MIKRNYKTPVAKHIILDSESDLMGLSQPLESTFEETKQGDGKSIWDDNLENWE